MTQASHATVRAWFSAHLRADAMDALRPLCVAKPQVHSVIGSLVDSSDVHRVKLGDIQQRIELREFQILELQGNQLDVATRWSATIAVQADVHDAAIDGPTAHPRPAPETSINIEGSTWFRMEQGLIAETWEHWDCEPLLARLGIFLS